MRKEELLETIKEKLQLFQPHDLFTEKPLLISRLALTVKRSANQVLQQDRCTTGKHLNFCLNTKQPHIMHNPHTHFSAELKLLLQ